LRFKTGKAGHFYNGEKGYSPLNLATSTIKDYLKEMIFNTSVTIVVISPNVKYSDWVDWEIRYSLREQTRGGITSHRNGIVCVIQNIKDTYGNMNTNWARDYNGKYKESIFPKAVVENLQETFPDIFEIYVNRLFDKPNKIKKDYCVLVSESSFKLDPSFYIEKAYRIAHDSSFESIVNKTDF
jgi:hypothetical protein